MTMTMKVVVVAYSQIIMKIFFKVKCSRLIFLPIDMLVRGI